MMYLAFLYQLILRGRDNVFMPSVVRIHKFERFAGGKLTRPCEDTAIYSVHRGGADIPATRYGSAYNIQLSILY